MADLFDNWSGSDTPPVSDVEEDKLENGVQKGTHNGNKAELQKSTEPGIMSLIFVVN